MILGPIFGPLLISFAVKMGIRLAATAVKGLVDAAPPSGGATGVAKGGFPTLLRNEEARQAPRIEASASPPLAATVPSDPVSLLASEEQVRALALGIRVGKGAPPPAADPHAKRHIAAYRRLHPFAG